MLTKEEKNHTFTHTQEPLYWKKSFNLIYMLFKQYKKQKKNLITDTEHTNAQREIENST